MHEQLGEYLARLHLRRHDKYGTLAKQLLDPSEFVAPIMPDIGGNQFVYRDGALVGVVDLDAYVVGPRELELAGVEICLTRSADFRRAYEAILPLPRFEKFRPYCRFWLMVCEAARESGPREATSYGECDEL